jgi:hypothetical protein
MHLPLELVALIAQHLSDVGRTSDLAAFACLLPRDGCYTSAVQRVLFGRVTINSYNGYANFTRTLQQGGTQERCLELASMVHDVSAVLNTQPDHEEQQFLAKHLLNLYDQCPELKRITVFGAHDGRFPEHLTPNADDLHHIETFNTIERLTLTCPLGLLGPSLLMHLPRLRELHIVGGASVFRLADPPRSGSQLRNITWGTETPPTFRLIKWLFAYSTEATGGTITLLTPPASALELEGISEYALCRKMDLRTPPALCLTEGET